MATKKRTKSVKNEAQIAEKAEQIQREAATESSTRRDRFQKAAKAFDKALNVAMQNGLAAGARWCEFTCEDVGGAGPAYKVLGLTKEQAAEGQPHAERTLGECGHGAVLADLLDHLDLPLNETVSAGDILLRALPIDGKKARLATLWDNRHGEDATMVLLASTFAEEVRKEKAAKSGKGEMQIAKDVRDAFNGDFTGEEDGQQIIEVDRMKEEQAAEAKTPKTPEQKVHERLASLLKAIAEIDDADQQKEMLKACRSSLTIKAVKATA